MRKPTMVDYYDRQVTFRQLAKLEGLKVATLQQRYYVQKLRGPALWAPSKRPRTHVQ